MSIITYKFRAKDRRASKGLAALAIACNQVWNYCAAVERESLSRWRAGRPVHRPTHFDLVKLTSGCTVELGLNSDTIDVICRHFAQGARKRCARFRASFGGKRALGFVPFRGRYVRIERDALIYRKKRYRCWWSREVQGKIKAGAFVEDARGRWYVTLQCEVADDLKAGTGSVGIDLGLKAVATLSNGSAVPALQFYRKYSDALATAQRAGNKHRARAISAKIANARRHQLHEASTKISNEFGLIVVGNVNSLQLAKTKMAKSVLDAGWGSFRSMLRYKAARRQAVYIEADERWTSQTCSCCGTIPDSSPKGMGALGIRHWECSACGASHDRDVNAALNILRVGLERQPPAGGISNRADVNSPSPIAAV